MKVHYTSHAEVTLDLDNIGFTDNLVLEYEGAKAMYPISYATEYADAEHRRMTYVCRYCGEEHDALAREGLRKAACGLGYHWLRTPDQSAASGDPWPGPLPQLVLRAPRRPKTSSSKPPKA